MQPKKLPVKMIKFDSEWYITLSDSTEHSANSIIRKKKFIEIRSLIITNTYDVLE